MNDILHKCIITHQIQFAGDTVLEIPEKYISRIGSDGFSSFHHVEEKQIVSKLGETVGTIIIAIQLASKCSMWVFKN